MTSNILRMGIAAAAVKLRPDKEQTTTTLLESSPSPQRLANYRISPQPNRFVQPRILVIPNMEQLNLVKHKPWSLFPDPNTREICQLVDLIRQAEQDPSIAGLHASFGSGSPRAGRADLENLRNALNQFAVKKQFSVAADKLDDDSYYLASTAHHIWIQETGEVTILGPCKKELFLTKKLEMDGIKMHVFRSGRYKGAGDVYTETKFLPSQRENKSDIMNQIQNDASEAIIKSRSRQLRKSSWFQQQRSKEKYAWIQLFWEHFLADESAAFPAVMGPYFHDGPPSESVWNWDKFVSSFQTAFEAYVPSVSEYVPSVSEFFPTYLDTQSEEENAWTQEFWAHFLADESAAFPAVMAPYFRYDAGMSGWNQPTLVSSFYPAIKTSFPAISRLFFDDHPDDKDVWSQILNEGVFFAPEARHAGLVDEVLDFDITYELLKANYSVGLDQYEKELVTRQRSESYHTARKQMIARLWSLFGFRSYLHSGDSGNADKIALLHVAGPIDANSANQFESLCRRIQIMQLCGKENIKCVVVSVETLGGDSYSSERMLQALKVTGLPVVCSLGNTATSAGYYIASTADRIFASKNTLTGSIGVIFIRPDYTKKLAKEGIHVDFIKTGELAGLYDPSHPLTIKMSRKIRESVDRSYDNFKLRVATGRKMTPDQVEAVAQGRLFSGSQAVQNGLCDEIGGLDDAINFATREYCGGKAVVVPFPQIVTFWEKVDAFFAAPGYAGESGEAKEAGLNCLSGSVSKSDMLVYMHDEEAAVHFLLKQ